MNVQRTLGFPEISIKDISKGFDSSAADLFHNLILFK